MEMGEASVVADGPKQLKKQKLSSEALQHMGRS